MASNSTNLLKVLQTRTQSLQAQGKMDDALRVAQTAADSARRNLASGDSQDTLDMVSTLLMLADLRRMQGDHDGAESVYLEGLQLASVAGESFIPGLEVARLQAGLASLYDFTDREGQALPLYLEAIERFEMNIPPELLEAAYLRNNVAMIWKGSGDYDAAEDQYLKALETFQTHLGDDSGTVATVLNNLGGLYSFMGQPERAEEFHQQALAMRERSGERNAPDLAQSLCNLATVFHQQENYAKARQFYEQARKLFEGDLAGAEEDYVILMNNFADLLRSDGEAAQAEALEKQMQGRLHQADASSQDA